MSAQEELSILLFCLPSSSPSMRGACERLRSHRPSLLPFPPIPPSLPPSLPPSAYLKAVSSDKHSKTVKPKNTTAFKRTQNVCIFPYPCASSCYVGTHVCKCGFAAGVSIAHQRAVGRDDAYACLLLFSQAFTRMPPRAEDTWTRPSTLSCLPDDTQNHPLEPSPPSSTPPLARLYVRTCCCCCCC